MSIDRRVINTRGVKVSDLQDFSRHWNLGPQITTHASLLTQSQKSQVAPESGVICMIGVIPISKIPGSN